MGMRVLKVIKAEEAACYRFIRVKYYTIGHLCKKY